MRNLPDLLSLAGFAAFMAGLVMVAGIGWALVAGGILLLALGLLATWKRHRP